MDICNLLLQHNNNSFSRSQPGSCIELHRSCITGLHGGASHTAACVRGPQPARHSQQTWPRPQRPLWLTAHPVTVNVIRQHTTLQLQHTTRPSSPIRLAPGSVVGTRTKPKLVQSGWISEIFNGNVLRYNNFQMKTLSFISTLIIFHEDSNYQLNVSKWRTSCFPKQWWWYIFINTATLLFGLSCAQLTPLKLDFKGFFRKKGLIWQNGTKLALP